jgi:hypothetical protein
VAWIVQVPPSPHHPKPRWQVRHQDGRRRRSAGIYHTPKAAEAVRKRIERGLPPTIEVVSTDVDAAKAQTLFGDHLEKVWWPTWKAQHPDSAYQTGKRIESASYPSLEAPRLPRWMMPSGSAFRRMRNWRVGIEARISHLKRGFGLRRTRLRRLAGARIWVGLGVFAYNLQRMTVAAR